MQSPSFRNTKHFQEESHEMIFEKKIENKVKFVVKFFNPLKWLHR